MKLAEVFGALGELQCGHGATPWVTMGTSWQQRSYQQLQCGHGATPWVTPAQYGQGVWLSGSLQCGHGARPWVALSRPDDTSRCPTLTCGHGATPWVTVARPGRDRLRPLCFNAATARRRG